MYWLPHIAGARGRRWAAAGTGRAVATVLGRAVASACSLRSVAAI